MAGWEAQFGVVAGVAFAMLLGGLIGFERELKNRPAGFRTHMLVAGAAALLVGMGPLMLVPYAGGQGPVLRIDPLRLVEAVVAGVGFIGAGTILGQRRGRQVTGLTTAASLLTAAGLTPSNSEAGRKLRERAVRIDGEVVEDPQRVLGPGFEGVLAVGKRNFARVRLVAEGALTAG